MKWLSKNDKLSRRLAEVFAAADQILKFGGVYGGLNSFYGGFSAAAKIRRIRIFGGSLEVYRISVQVQWFCLINSLNL